MACPNKNSLWWTGMVNDLGEQGAWYVWAMSEGRPNEEKIAINKWEKSQYKKETFQDYTQLQNEGWVRGKVKIDDWNYIHGRNSKENRLTESKLVEKFKKGNPELVKSGKLKIQGNKFRFKAHNIFFQEKEDARLQDVNLDKIIMKRIREMGITVQNIDNEYRKNYEEKYGTKLTAVALANITQQVIAVAHGEAGLSTLTEEALHFVVHAMWDESAMRTIRGVDADNNIINPWLEKSKIYQDNYDEYYTRYQGNKTMVLKEIVAKVLAEEVITQFKKGDYEQSDRIDARIIRLIVKTLKNLWARIVGSKVDTSTIPADVQEVMGKMAREFLNEGLDINSVIFKNTATDSENLTLNHFVNSPVIPDAANKMVEALYKSYDILTKQYDRLVQQQRGLNSEEAKLRWKELIDKYGEQWNDLEIEYAELQANSAKTEGDYMRLHEMEELFKFHGLIKQDKDSLRVMKRILAQKREIERSMEEMKLELGLVSYVMGTLNKEGIRAGGGLSSQLSNILRNIRRYNLDPQDENYKKLTPELYAAILKFYNENGSIIRDLYKLHITDGYKFEELSEDLRKPFIQQLRFLDSSLSQVDLFISAQHKKIGATLLDKQFRDPSGNLIDPSFNAANAMEDSMYYDRNYIQYFFGGVQHAENDILGAALKYIEDIRNDIKSKTRDRGSDLYRSFKPLSDAMRVNPIIRDFMRKHKLDSVQEIYMERDKDGIPTGYLINEHDSKKYDDAYNEVVKNTVQLIKRMAAKSNLAIPIPDGNTSADIKKRQDIFSGKTLLRLGGYSDKLSNLRKLREYKEFYNRRIDEFVDNNTVVHPKAAEIYKQRKADMTETQFKNWENKNVIKTKGEISGYRGELLVPNDTYRNEVFTQLSEVSEFKQGQKLFFDQLERSNKELPFIFYGKHHRKFWLPQISESFSDILFRDIRNQTDLKKKISTQVGDVYKQRADDDLYKEIDSYLVVSDKSGDRDAPIRYRTPLHDPSILGSNLIQNMVLYDEMALRYQAFRQAAPTLLAFRQTIIENKYKSSARRGLRLKRENEIISGDQSNILKSFDTMVDMLVEGETLQKSLVRLRNGTIIDKSKLASNIRNYIQRNYLQGNIIAAFAQYFMGNTMAWTNAMAGRDYTVDSLLWAKKELAKALPNIIQEYGEIVPDSDMGMIVDYLQFFTTNGDMFNLANKKKVVRMATSFMDFGIWRLSDYTPKVTAALAYTDSWRLDLDGNWVNREQYLDKYNTNEAGETIPRSEIEKGWKSLKDDWIVDLDGSLVKREDLIKAEGPNASMDGRGEGRTAYAALRVDINEAGHREVGIAKGFRAYWTEEMKLTLMRGTKTVVNGVDTQLSDIDKGKIHQNYLAQFLMTFKSFLVRGAQVLFKGQHRNYITGRKESGAYIVGTSHYLRAIIADFQNNGFKAFVDQYHNLDHHERAGVIHTLGTLSFSIIAYFAAYILNAAADDDDDDYMTEIAAYLATRVFIEHSAAFSPTDLWSIVQRPVAGTDNVRYLGEALLGTLGEVLAVWDWFEEDPTISRGIYKGRTKLEKTFIKLTPMLKGTYELILSGDKGIKAKRDFMIDAVLEPDEALNLPTYSKPIIRWFTDEVLGYNIPDPSKVFPT